MARARNTQAVRRSLKIALVFQVIWLIIGLLFSIFGEKVSWFLLIGNMFTLWVPALLILFTGVKLSKDIQIAYGIFITASSLVGSSLGGYASIPSWDTVVHVFSGILLSWFGFIVATQAEGSIKKPLPIWFKNVVAFMTPMAFAAAWEIYEFTSDKYLHTTMQAGGLQDTIVDMAAALVGATIWLVASLGLFWIRKNKSI